ncbi:MAG: hypothetical protein O3B73_06325, partial [bacterium]|nr:hypothetical protein [bacterium]
LAGADILTYTKMVDVLSRALGRWLIKVHVPMSLGLIIAGLGNRFSPRFPVQPDQIRRMKEDRAFDISEARSALGFDPVGFEAGIRAALQGIEP